MDNVLSAIPVKKDCPDADSREENIETDKIIDFYRKSSTEELCAKASEVALERHGKSVYLRGLIEFSNYCSMDCLYCGIRRGNNKAVRYRLSGDEIVSAAKSGWSAGLKTFVLQGGEDPYCSTDMMCRVTERIKELTAGEAAVTLSLGIKSKADYSLLKKAGADRYLIRFETSDPDLHRYLRGGVTLERRLEAIYDLKELGFETGSGYMTGLPGETEETRINNALLCRKLGLDMAGIGPFIPHNDTPLAGEKQMPLDLCIRATALLRLLLPEAHIPATTAAGSLEPDGRERMIAAGANVLMPNITPLGVKKHYLLYPGKICLEESGLECIGCLSMRVKTAGRELDFGLGSALRKASEKTA